MFAGYRGTYNIPVEVHEDAVMELSGTYHHLPVRDIILRGGTLFGFHGQYQGDAFSISSGCRWKCWGLNGPITALPSLNGKPSRIVARLSHLAHGDGSATTFDVHDGATLEIDTALEPGRANTSSNPNDGSFIKIGGGTLKLLKPCGAKGLIDIREGTVELAEGGRFNPAAKVNVSPRAKLVLGDKVQMANTVDLASALCASADVWLDASRISAADGATVSSVPNLGTAGGEFAKFTWTTSGRRIPDLPTYVADGINGKGVLHFNGVQALCLPTYTNKTEYLKVFYVSEWTYWSQGTGSQGGMGKWGGPFSFGNRSMTGDDNHEPGVLSYQHGNTTVSTLYTFPNNSASMLVSGLNVGHNDTCKNKNVNVEFVCVGGRTTTGGAAQVTSTTPTVGSSDRMYVGHIGEMLAFTRKLTADEEDQILAYLKRKWFNSSVAVPEETEKALANTVHIEVPEGAEASYVANVAGKTDGTSFFDLTKTGAGTLRYGGAVTGGAILDVEAGGLALKDGRLPSQVDVWVDGADLSTMTFDADNRVTNLVNKGSAGGSFVRNTRKAAVPFGPTVKEGADGINGNPVLAFDGNEATPHEIRGRGRPGQVGRPVRVRLDGAERRGPDSFRRLLPLARQCNRFGRGSWRLLDGVHRPACVGSDGHLLLLQHDERISLCRRDERDVRDGDSAQGEDRREVRAVPDRHPPAGRTPDELRRAAVVQRRELPQPFRLLRHRRDDRHHDAAGRAPGGGAA